MKTHLSLEKDVVFLFFLWRLRALHFVSRLLISDLWR